MKVLSFDNGYNYLTQKRTYSIGQTDSLQFTLDDKCIVCPSNNELVFLNISERKVNHTKDFSHNGNDKSDLMVRIVRSIVND